MLRFVVALVSLAVLAGCAAPEAPTDAATLQPTRSDPFATPSGNSAPTVMTPTALPSSPPSTPAPQTGFTLWTVAGSDGVPKFLGSDGSANPTLLVTAGSEVTIDLIRNGTLHAFTVNGEPVVGAGTDDVRATFTAPQSGSVEYDCPIHPQAMRGTIQTA